MSRLLLALVPMLVFASLACRGGDRAPSTRPEQTKPVTGATATHPPPTDGTVAQQNAGATDPVRIKANPDPAREVAVLKDVRAGAHPENGGWDRIVFEFLGALPAGEVRYASGPQVQCGSGFPVTIRGSALLTVRFDLTQAHDDAGQLTIERGDIEMAGPGTSILEAKRTCDFEGEVSWALGTSGRKNFKVTTLANPPRVVIDVKH